MNKILFFIAFVLSGVSFASGIFGGGLYSFSNDDDSEKAFVSKQEGDIEVSVKKVKNFEENIRSIIVAEDENIWLVQISLDKKSPLIQQPLFYVKNGRILGKVSITKGQGQHPEFKLKKHLAIEFSKSELAWILNSLCNESISFDKTDK